MSHECEEEADEGGTMDEGATADLPKHMRVGDIDNRAWCCYYLQHMGAELLLDERRILSESEFVEMVVWQLPEEQAGVSHRYKYRLALVVDGECVLRYDNESGKGDHKHTGDKQTAYRFTTPEALLKDFWNDVDKWRSI